MFVKLNLTCGSHSLYCEQCLIFVNPLYIYVWIITYDKIRYTYCPEGNCFGHIQDDICCFNTSNILSTQ